MQTTWDTVIDAIGEDLEALPWGHFLIVEFPIDEERDICPYAQVARDAPGFRCEAASARFFSQEDSPLDTAALRAAGWIEPYGQSVNWTRSEYLSARDAAAVMVASLRDARGCSSPSLLRWWSERFPDPPGDGESIPSDVAAQRAISA